MTQLKKTAFDYVPEHCPNCLYLFRLDHDICPECEFDYKNYYATLHDEGQIKAGISPHTYTSYRQTVALFAIVAWASAICITNTVTYPGLSVRFLANAVVTVVLILNQFLLARIVVNNLVYRIGNEIRYKDSASFYVSIWRLPRLWYCRWTMIAWVAALLTAPIVLYGIPRLGVPQWGVMNSDLLGLYVVLFLISTQLYLAVLYHVSRFMFDARKLGPIGRHQ